MKKSVAFLQHGVMVIPLPAATQPTMKTNFESAITAAIETVAALLNEPIEKIATEALNEGPIRDSVMVLAIHTGIN